MFSLFFKQRSQSKLLDDNDLKEVTKLREEMDSRVVSPAIRSLLLLYEKNHDVIVSYPDCKSKDLADLETKFVNEAKERKAIGGSDIVFQEEEEDGEDINASIRRRNQKRELSIVSANLKLNKKVYCHYFCNDEIDFVRKNSDKKETCKYYTFQHSPNFDPFNPCGEDFHFKLAQNFLISAPSYYNYYNSNFALNEVTYVCNPYLAKKFYDKKREMAKRHGFLLESMKPMILFHGNRLESNYDNIMKTNFSLSKVGSNTGNYGVYGRGIYFSSFPSVSMGYAGSNILLICLVYVGKAYLGGSLGCSKQEGYDSHLSGDGASEVVIFHEDQILPMYKVKFNNA